MPIDQHALAGALRSAGVYEGHTWIRKVRELGAERDQLRNELTEHEDLFTVRLACAERARQMWQDAGNDPLTWPDGADLMVWLMRRITELEREKAALHESASAAEFDRDDNARWLGTERGICVAVNGKLESAEQQIVELQAVVLDVPTTWIGSTDDPYAAGDVAIRIETAQDKIRARRGGEDSK